MNTVAFCRIFLYVSIYFHRSVGLGTRDKNISPWEDELKFSRRNLEANSFPSMHNIAVGARQSELSLLNIDAHACTSSGNMTFHLPCPKLENETKNLAGKIQLSTFFCCSWPISLRFVLPDHHKCPVLTEGTRLYFNVRNLELQANQTLTLKTPWMPQITLEKSSGFEDFDGFRSYVQLMSDTFRPYLELNISHTFGCDNTSGAGQFIDHNGMFAMIDYSFIFGYLEELIDSFYLTYCAGIYGYVFASLMCDKRMIVCPALRISKLDPVPNPSGPDRWHCFNGSDFNHFTPDVVVVEEPWKFSTQNTAKLPAVQYGTPRTELLLILASVATLTLGFLFAAYLCVLLKRARRRNAHVGNNSFGGPRHRRDPVETTPNGPPPEYTPGVPPPSYRDSMEGHTEITLVDMQEDYVIEDLAVDAETSSYFGEITVEQILNETTVEEIPYEETPKNV